MTSLLLSDYDARCAGGSDIVGHLPYLYQRALATDGYLVELGVRSGESTCAFLAALAASDTGFLYSVDIDNPRWYFVQGDDMILAQADGVLPDEVDLLFIDSSHQYQHTYDELNLYGARVEDGGVILLHDTDLEVAPGSVRDEDKDFPVRRAVQEWCREHGLTPEFREGWHGLGVIEVNRG